MNLEWNGKTCKTKIEEQEESGITIVTCECESLNPTSLISDIDHMFQNSKISDVFSEEGFKYFKILLFLYKYLNLYLNKK